MSHRSVIQTLFLVIPAQAGIHVHSRSQNPSVLGNPVLVRESGSFTGTPGNSRRARTESSYPLGALGHSPRNLYPSYGSSDLILDPDGVSIFSNADVDPQVLRTRPLFWTAKAGTTLGPASLPILGEKPFRAQAVDGVLQTTDSTAEALIYVGAGTAAKLRGMTLLGKLVRTGSIAILLRPDEE